MSRHDASRSPIARLSLLRHDRVLWFGFTLLMLVGLPLLIPRLGADQLSTYSDFFLDVPLLAFLIVLALVDARAAHASPERRFWYLVAGAFGCWLLVRVINIAWLLHVPIGHAVESDVAGDVIYVGFYLLLAVALELNPHEAAQRSERAGARMIEAAGAIVVVFALLAYFVVIPRAVNAAAYDTWVPSLLLYVVLDGYLVVRLAALRYSRPPPPWNRVYGWLLVTAVLWLMTDALEASFWAGIVHWVGPGTPLDLLWLPAYGTMMMAIRSAASPLPAANLEGPPSRRDPLAGLWGGPVVLYAAAAPVLHFGLYAFGVLDPISRDPREALTFGTIVVLAILAWFYQRTVEWENRRLAAELRAMVAQLRPHFLLNSLHSLAALLRRDPAAAEQGLVQLGDLLRHTLHGVETVRIPLADEWKFTRAYLELEQLRLGERLRVESELSDEAATCEVPRLIVQPLAENAVRHAAAARTAGARIQMRAWVDGTTLHIAVEDDGPGAEPHAMARAPGLGLRAVRAQLAAHYGDRAQLEINAAPGAGLRATIRVPADAE